MKAVERLVLDKSSSYSIRVLGSTSLSLCFSDSFTQVVPHLAIGEND